MTTTLLTRVKSKLFVHARRRSRSLLEGEYASVFHGRSLDYDDLRDYVPGDEVRDIDWRATARHAVAARQALRREPQAEPHARRRHRPRDGGRDPQRRDRRSPSRSRRPASSATWPSATVTSSGSSAARPGRPSRTSCAGAEVHLELLLRAVDRRHGPGR